MELRTAPCTSCQNIQVAGAIHMSSLCAAVYHSCPVVLHRQAVHYIPEMFHTSCLLCVQHNEGFVLWLAMVNTIPFVPSIVQGTYHSIYHMPYSIQVCTTVHNKQLFVIGYDKYSASRKSLNKHLISGRCGCIHPHTGRSLPCVRLRASAFVCIRLHTIPFIYYMPSL